MIHVNLPDDKIPHPSANVDGTFGHELGEQHIGAERRPSTMRVSTHREPITKNVTEKEWILRRRGCFSSLPTGCGNDMILGSWWFVAGSVLTMLIPAFPLISIYQQPSQRFWPTAEAFVIPVDDHSAVYALLVGCGVFFVLGSLFLVRAFKEPTPMPFFSCSILATDEVVASWLYFLGTIPTVPLTVIYVAYFPGVHYYEIALVFCIAASFVMLLFTYAVYPTANSFKPYQIVSPVVHKLCCGPTNKLYRHVQNDWLIVCWLVFIGSLLATIASCAALIYYAKLHNRRGIFDYATGAFDCLLFTIGSAYFIAGSYPVHSEYDEECGGIGVPAFSEERRRGKDVKVYSEEVPENFSADGENLWHNHGSDDNNESKRGGRLPPIKSVSLSSDARGTFDSALTDPRSGTTRKASKGRSPSVPESASGSEPVVPGRRRSLEESFAATSASKFAPRTRSNSPPTRGKREEEIRAAPTAVNHTREEMHKRKENEGSEESEEEEEKKYDVEANVRSTVHATVGASHDTSRGIPLNPFSQTSDDSATPMRNPPTNPFSG